MTEPKPTRAPRAPKATEPEPEAAQLNPALALLARAPRLVPISQADYHATEDPSIVVLPSPVPGTVRLMDGDEYAARMAHLVAPFRSDELERLPKQLRAGDQDRGPCTTATGNRYSKDGHHCGGYHALSIHLTYVGHAGITMRLLQVDPLYELVPVEQMNGVPVANPEGSWWRLTVLGMTRVGYGDATGKRGANAVKEVIGDALRNAALRFGVATYLWSKSEEAQLLQAGGEVADEPAEPPMQRSSGRAHAPVEQPAEPRPAPPVATVLAYRAHVLRIVDETDRGPGRDTKLRALRDEVAQENPGALDVAVPVPAAWSATPDEPGEATLMQLLLGARGVVGSTPEPSGTPQDDPWATPAPAEAGSYEEGTR